MLKDNNDANLVIIELRRIMRAIDLHSRKLIQECNLTGPQLLILRSLKDCNEMSMSELAKQISLSNATLSGIIDRLERNGFVERKRNTSDRRQIFVQKTEKGSKTIQTAPPFLQEKFIAELSGLQKWEREQLLASLSRIAHMMNAEKLDASPVLSTLPLTISDNLVQNIASDINNQSNAKTNGHTAKGTGKNSLLTKKDNDNLNIKVIKQPGDFPEWISRDQLVHFLHNSLKPYEDSIEDIQKAFDYVFSEDAGKGGFILVGRIENKVVGSLVMLNTGMSGYVPENLLLFVAVDPAGRGLGVGSQIIRRSFELAEGAIKLHVEYDNPAKRLYERLGLVSKYAEMRYIK